MKKNRMKTLTSIFVFAFISLSFTVIGLFNFNYSLGNEFTVKIHGTSNVHDWESSITECTGVVEVTKDANSDIQISKCEITIPVKSIKSTKGSIMDKKTYAALKESKHPNINFTLTSFKYVINNGNEFTANCIGYLTIAGVEKSITMSVRGKELQNGNIEIWGSKKLKMTTFNIDPPKALLGALTTSDDITIEYHVELLRD